MHPTPSTLYDRAWTRFGGWLVDMLSQAIVLEGTFDRSRRQAARTRRRNARGPRIRGTG
jgi:hypothetical protein